MPSNHNGKQPVSTDAGTRAQQESLPEQDGGLEAVKPHLTGMTGMHSEQPEEDAATGSPGADIDRDLAEEK